MLVAEGDRPPAPMGAVGVELRRVRHDASSFFFDVSGILWVGAAIGSYRKQDTGFKGQAGKTSKESEQSRNKLMQNYLPPVAYGPNR